MSRRLLGEFIGTFALVFFGCGAIIWLQGLGLAGSIAINSAFGLTVLLMVVVWMRISGAHFNPAVTVGLAASKKFPWKEAPVYIAVQVLGAVAASGLHVLLLKERGLPVSFGSTTTSLAPWQAIFIEIGLTFILMSVILIAATRGKTRLAVAVPIGLAVGLCGMFGGPLTGCSMNPARSFGPALWSGPAALGQFWIYICGPVLGALLAASVFLFVESRAPQVQTVEG